MRINSIFVAILLALVADLAGAADYAFFAMDAGTKDARHKTAGERVAMVKELGFDGIGPNYSTSAELRDMLAAVDQHHLKLFAEYVGLDLDSASPVSPQIRDTISQLKGRDAVLWLFVMSKKFKPSDPAGDERAVSVLREIADLAEPAGVRVALYPHANLWVERVDDGVRLARQVNRKNVGVTFNLCHWLMVDGKDLETRLDEAKPYLFMVTINGADAGAKDWKRLIQPLDAGTYDVGRVLTELQRIGYTGPIGLQHFGIRGDARKNLERSMNGWRRLRGVELLPAGQALEEWQPVKGWVEVGGATLDPQNATRLTTMPGKGVIISAGKAGYLVSRKSWGDVAVHVEFMIPKHSNSGVYIMGSYEVQIYDSFGVEKDHYPGIECGGIYPEWVNNANVRGHSPLVNATLPHGQWQTFDIAFQAPRFDTAGNKVANARFLEVFHNGKLVQKNVEVLGPTRGGFPEMAMGPLRLQGDHGPIAYRNLRVLIK